MKYTPDAAQRTTTRNAVSAQPARNNARTDAVTESEAQQSAQLLANEEETKEPTEEAWLLTCDRLFLVNVNNLLA